MDSSIPRDAVWLVAYLTALHAMLPFAGTIEAQESRIPGDAKFLANQAVEHYDEFLSKGDGR